MKVFLSTLAGLATVAHGHIMDISMDVGLMESGGMESESSTETSTGTVSPQAGTGATASGLSAGAIGGIVVAAVAAVAVAGVAAGYVYKRRSAAADAADATPSDMQA
eukprot:Clim_evm1s88 gene=Clim_evmTU1s88